jgi:hypothetical protein
MLHALFRLLQEAGDVPEAAPSGGLSSRTVVLALMIILPAVSTLMVVFGGIRLMGIAKRIPKIVSKSQLETLRKEHKLHSMMALLIRAFLGIANVLFFIDLFFLGGPISDLLYSIIPSIISIAVSVPFRGVEQKVNDLECANEDLRKEWLEIKQG